MKAEQFQEVEKPIVGQRYHLAWADKRCRWNLEKINSDGTCVMWARKSNKRLTAKINDLRHIRAHETSYPNN